MREALECSVEIMIKTVIKQYFNKKSKSMEELTQDCHYLIVIYRSKVVSDLFIDNFSIAVFTHPQLPRSTLTHLLFPKIHNNSKKL